MLITGIIITVFFISLTWHLIAYRAASTISRTRVITLSIINNRKNGRKCDNRDYHTNAIEDKGGYVAAESNAIESFPSGLLLPGFTKSVALYTYIHS